MILFKYQLEYVENILQRVNQLEEVLEDEVYSLRHAGIGVDIKKVGGRK